VRNPLRHHNKAHRRSGHPFDTCWDCAREKAVCAAKIRFGSWQEANEWVDNFNAERGFQDGGKPVMRYRCRWCEGWHMATARHPRTRARVERWRRKWLIAQEAQRGAGGPGM
jgi:hypothetical protein